MNATMQPRMLLAYKYVVDTAQTQPCKLPNCERRIDVGR